ncbi:hypothetical protein [Ignavigranum ruoffiae]|uniref:hypothetical protein n=1 Tax=Ignavigranum ruoffiae TaxID=89093 RepID=UPI0024AD280D|nr:hypothetical protein [Ignavigranum ruoffiae]
MEIKGVKLADQTASDFINLVNPLYPPSQRRPRAELIRQLLQQSHPLSSQFDFKAYLLYQDQQAIMRAALTLYPQRKEAYLGFFEGVNQVEALRYLMDHLAAEAQALGYQALVGPIDASFWLGYRMKIDRFDLPAFTGEPHNLPYYPELWRAAGFEQIETYLSNTYPAPAKNFQPRKLEQRYQHFKALGINFRSVNRHHWSVDLQQMYRLLTELYRDFPYFEEIDQKTFIQLFDPLKKVLNFSRVQLAFDQDCLVGFMIAIPNYGHLLDQELNLFRLLQILQRKYWAKEYIMMYLGVDPAYLGLGSALVYPLVKQFQDKHIRSIGALIHQGKVSENYLGKMIEHQTHYALFRKDLANN